MSYLKRIVALSMVVALSVFAMACGEDDSPASEETTFSLDSEVEEVEEECRGPNPAGCTQTGCEDGEVCEVDPDSCEPSACSCDDGSWVCTDDCAGGGQCVDEEQSCEGPNPAGCTQTGCEDGEKCLVDEDTCAPSTCSCTDDGNWLCTDDCGGGGQCVSEEEYEEAG